MAIQFNTLKLAGFNSIKYLINLKSWKSLKATAKPYLIFLFLILCSK